MFGVKGARVVKGGKGGGSEESCTLNYIYLERRVFLMREGRLEEGKKQGKCIWKIGKEEKPTSMDRALLKGGKTWGE